MLNAMRDLNTMSVEEAFWNGFCVGLYEGEGTANVQAMNSTNPERKYVRLIIRMTDSEPVERVMRTWGGRYAGPEITPSEQARGYKPKYRWSIATVDETLALIRFMQPFLSPRRQAQLQKGLDLVTPRVRQRPQPGNRRRKQLPPYRGRRSGRLVCPSEPEPSARGLLRHKLLGIPVCDICRASYNLYYAQRRRWAQERIKETNANQYAKNREERIAYQRAYYAANRERLQAAQRERNARRRQAQTSVEGSASPPSEIQST